MTAKNIVRGFLPPYLFDLLLRLKKKSFEFEGNYASWDEAAAACKTEGYAEDSILHKTLNSILAVKSGDAVFERDSVLFDEIQYSWPLLSAILLAASHSEKNFKVLDFGGSLGSTYFQNKKFFQALPQKVIYGVVEQPHYINLGNEQISDSSLSFYSSTEDYIYIIGKPDIVILSGVLQNLESYSLILNNLLSKDVKFVCVDRTPFLSSENDEKIMIQNVSKPIYDARYPHRFFEKTGFLSIFKFHNYQLLESFSAIDSSNRFATWEGFIFMKKFN